MKKWKCHHLVLGWFLGIVFAVLVTGCQNDLEAVELETSTPMITPTTTRTPTITPSPTQTMTPTRTSTPLPTHTWTPLPTLSQEEAIEQVRALFTGDEICRLPCWGNIIPGETTWVEAKAYLETFAKVEDPPERIFKSYELPNFLEPEEPFGMGLIVNRYTKLIDVIDVAYWYDYRLDQLLRSYGPPAEIWLRADVDISKRPAVLRYDILLFYPDQGFLAAYRGNGEISPIYDICPSKIDYESPQPVLKLWSPEQEFNFEDVMRKYGVDLGRMERYERIEEVEITGMTVQEFYEIFRDPENSDVCIQVPAPD